MPRPKSSRYDGDIERGVGVEFVETTPAPDLDAARTLASRTTIREFLAPQWQWPRHLADYTRRHGGVLRLGHDHHHRVLYVIVEVCDREAWRTISSVEFERRAHAVIWLTVVIDQLLAQACTEELETRAAMPADN